MRQLKREGIPARVVSMPSWELFEQQDQAYRDQRSSARCRGAGLGRDGLGDRLGPLCRARPAPRSACTRSAPRRRSRTCSRSSASRPRRCSPPRRSRSRSAKEVRMNPQANRIPKQAKAVANPLAALHDYGQAVWLDFLARRFIAEGGLKKLVEQDGLTGVTSNPSIFEKAIAGSADYDAALKEIVADGDCRCHDALRAAGDRGHPARGRRAASGLRGDRRARTDMSASKSRPIWR